MDISAGVVRGLANQPRWRILVGALAGFVGLCTIFALVTTAGTAWMEHTQVQWPEAIAQIEKCAVVPISFGRRDRYYIDCRLSYQANSQPATAHVYSRQVYPGVHRNYPSVETLQEWAAAHPQGTPIAIHYDPANPTKIVLGKTDMPATGPTTPNNVKLLVTCAAIFAVLFTIAKIGR